MRVRRARLALALAGLAVPLVLAATITLAQGNPFGAPVAAQAAGSGGWIGWILSEQASIYRALSKLVRQSKADGSALWALAGFSFLYGVLHAAGPGHGKAVISSYLVARNESWTRGLVLSAVASLLQALVAIALVGIGAGLLQITARSMGAAISVIEIACYALIIAIGLRLLWQSAPAFVRAFRAVMLQSRAASLQTAGGPTLDSAFDDACCSYHARLQSRERGSFATASGASARGGFACAEAGAAEHSANWRDGLSAVIATGARPCSGAVLILVFAFSQELYATGAMAALAMGLGTAATVAAFATATVLLRDLMMRFAGARSAHASLVLSGLKTAAALLVTLFGALLLVGYMASERIGMLG